MAGFSFLVKEKPVEGNPREIPAPAIDTVARNFLRSDLVFMISNGFIFLR
jgi:hypothetical protein